MKPQTRWSILVLVAMIFVAVGMVLPATVRTNCGGNSAALAACKHYSMVLQLWTVEHPGEQLRYDSTDAELRCQLTNLPGTVWLRSAKLLARLEGVRLDPAGPRQVILVCDQAYGNVPHRFFGTSPLTHAVAYSTGETGLITPPEVALLPIGAYYPDSFRNVHMGPDEAVKVFQELRARWLVPMHFGTFQLSFEDLDEPPRWLKQVAQRKGMLHHVKILEEGVPQVF